MPAIDPFANEADSVEIGDLTIENRLDLVAIYGDIQLTRDKRGLEHAKALKAVLDAVVEVLENDRNLPDAIRYNPIDEVNNPFQ